MTVRGEGTRRHRPGAFLEEPVPQGCRRTASSATGCFAGAYRSLAELICASGVSAGGLARGPARLGRSGDGPVAPETGAELCRSKSRKECAARGRMGKFGPQMDQTSPHLSSEGRGVGEEWPVSRPIFPLGHLLSNSEGSSYRGSVTRARPPGRIRPSQDGPGDFGLTPPSSWDRAPKTKWRRRGSNRIPAWAPQSHNSIEMRGLHRTPV